MRGLWIFAIVLFVLWLLGMLPIKLKIKGSNEEFEAKLKILFLSFKFGGNNKKEKKPKKEKEHIKKQLTNIINHELITPVASIRVCVETLMAHGNLSEEKKKLFLQRLSLIHI